MVQLLLASTPKIRQVLEYVYSCQDACNHSSVLELKNQLSPYLATESCIPFDLLKACYFSSQESKLVSSFKELIQGSQIVFHQPPAKPKSPELQKILNEAQKIIDARLYFEMTNKSFESHASVSLAPQERMTDSQFLIGVANVFFSAISVFVAVIWISTEYDISMHVLAALFFAILVLGAEAFLAYRRS